MTIELRQFLYAEFKYSRSETIGDLIYLVSKEGSRNTPIARVEAENRLRQAWATPIDDSMFCADPCLRFPVCFWRNAHYLQQWLEAHVEEIKITGCAYLPADLLQHLCDDTFPDLDKVNPRWVITKQLINKSLKKALALSVMDCSFYYYSKLVNS